MIHPFCHNVGSILTRYLGISAPPSHQGSENNLNLSHKWFGLF